MKDYSIFNQLLGSNHPPKLIAELSANHNGSLERALKTIEEAHRCGADAIKIQTYTADTMTIDSDRVDFMIKGGLWDGYKLYDLYNRAHTPYEWHKPMFDHAKKIGITIFSSPFDETAVDLLEQLNCPAYKIASCENTDLPLIDYVARTGKPMLISTGMASGDEITEAVDTAHSAGCKNLVLLHCVSSYPTPLKEANISRIKWLAQTFNVPTGLSDHTLSSTSSVTATALGACVIEKHFTLNRCDKGADSEFSLEPEDFKNLCISCKDAWHSLGQDNRKASPSEEQTRLFRRSIYFVNDLDVGTVIKHSDIRRIRPGLGLPPKYFDEIVGKKLKVAVKRGMATSWELFDE